MAAVNQAIDAGMPREQAYRHADTVRTLALFAGGKNNLPGWIGSVQGPGWIGAARTIHTLQQYGFGLTGRMGTLIRDSISNDPSLTPVQRTQAMKGAGTLLMTTLAMSGAMGVPGVAAGMALIHKMFGVDAETGTREGLMKLAETVGNKDNTGFNQLFTEMAMNGGVNQLTGVSIGNRLGVSDFLGTSAYDGYNFYDMLGPTGSLVSNMVMGTQALAQGDTGRAMTDFAPNAFKHMTSMFMNHMKYGDNSFRTVGEKPGQGGQPLFKPTASEAIRYAAGFNPTRLTQLKTQNRLISQSNDEYKAAEKQKLDEAARAYGAGNKQQAFQWVREQVQTDPALQRHVPELVRELIDRSVEMHHEVDPLSKAPVGNYQNAQQIAGTFPDSGVQRPSELDLVREKMQAEIQGGVPRQSYQGELRKAATMDRLMSQGLRRDQAERMVEMMGMGR
jgi:hypothetical protein